MNEFVEYCNKISPLTPEAKEEVLSKLKTKIFKKGEEINKMGSICRSLFFINSGLAKHYYYHKNKILILRFFSENNVFTIFDSFINQTPAEFITVAMENTTTTYLDYNDIEELCAKHHSFESFIRKYISVAAVKTMKRVKEMLDKDATERYIGFMKENNYLLQRISLGDIASYLGISQVSLSRIRSRM